ncbi:hypothetical protein [Clostridium botulinum]|uniref:hypothetical protein n=1 Tax=Clostridium botulinum TaxID=1491 RepID=UPI00174DF47A|nr:hypothetical protein [Clostridium botulinum]MBD5589325.1 hypothetical protein [Clostridium botulinum]
MNIAIIDADLIGRKRHRFPNLACMKISGYYKSKGHTVTLKIDYEDVEIFDKVFISKVFTDTPIDENILKLDNVEYGGTGFFYDKAKPLPYEVEHHMPDYHLYNDWVNKMIDKGVKPRELEYYTDYSIGFTTRGCFRKCPFCVNQKYNKVELHSPINEFLDISRKYICLLDDNILGYSGWKDIINQLKLTNKYFQYKQGMDERLMTKEKAMLLSSCKYKGDYIFAFDNIEDKEIIKEKLSVWKTYCKKTTKLYVLCGFDKANKYDKVFWKQDIINTFQRIKILMQYGCLPYIMRFNRYEESPCRGMYINLARWCNQPSFFKKKSFREFCIANGENSSTMKYANKFEKDFPDIAANYYDLKYEKLNEYSKEIKKAI